MARSKSTSSLDLKSLPAVIESVKTPVGFSALCVVILALGALSWAAWVSEANQKILIVSVMGILGFVILGTLGLAFWRPEALTGNQKIATGSNTDDIKSYALDEALRTVLERNRRIDVLRVFALTSGQITPLLYNLIDGVFIGEIRIILFEPSETDTLSKETIAKIRQNYEGIAHYLDQLRTKVRKVEVKFQPFCPTEYYITLDNRELILGWFRYDPSSFTGFRAEKPIVMRGNGLLRDVIRQKAELFDTWFKGA
jgi:hypothetical protein